ncbi:hypothetical protein LRAMOSA03233 [Lichtheimia ramosa]|uniref:Uncharacterized protein n=1 Tax=Lichtheimia ramosa TaxID=688394 RepID=A0A077WUN5_9FUNG|nr:hypothetical protein LRAMOSA03233 [Lichtheimia ramosa]
MTPLPPTFRTYIPPETLPERKSYPAAEGTSLIMLPVYAKSVIFFEQDDTRGGRVPVDKLQEAIAKALSIFYPFAGRLSPRPRGRFAVQDFDKGCLFQVCELPDSIQEYKRNHFGYATLPITDLVPLLRYTSLDMPLLGIQLTQLQDGQVLGLSFNHRISDGLAAAGFRATMAQIVRGEQVPPFDMYHDWQRPPLYPSPKYDHSIDYPVMKEIPEGEDPGPTIQRVFPLPIQHAEELKRQIQHEIPNKNIQISLRDAIAAFMYRSIVKARRIKGKCDFVYVVSKRHEHPDKRLQQHFGNYIVGAVVPEKHDELMRRPMSSTAQRIREQVAKVNPEYMDSLEYYLNNVQDPSMVSSPRRRMTRGCVIWSDWSRFSYNTDYGYGKSCGVIRNCLNPSPRAVVTMLPKREGLFDLIVQMDPESMLRLQDDEQIQRYTLGAF